MKNQHWAIAVAIAAACFAIAPAVTQPFTGYTADQLPFPQPDPVIQPPGWVFSIWGVIYSGLILGAGFGLLKRRGSEDWRAMRPGLAAALVVGTVWLAIANWSPILATVTIIAMALCAVHALVKTGQQDWWWQVAPVAIFAGWLTAASGVSLSVTLAGFGVLSAQIAAIGSLLLVLLAAVAVQARRQGAWPYSFGVGWALMGVSVSAAGQSNWPVLCIALIGLLVMAYHIMRALR